MKTCPGCNKKVSPKQDLCECGYDFTMDECPGCDARIPQDLDTCPNCNYDLILGEKPIARPVPRPAPVEVKRAATPAGLKKSAVIALSNFGSKDVYFAELHWPKGQEVTDAGLEVWAERFRLAYREKVPGRKDCYPTNSAIHHYCRVHSGDPVLQDHADRMLTLIGGRD